MYCGVCDNIPFWRWLKVKQTFPTSIFCNDFNGEYLSSLQPNNVTGALVSICVLGFESVIKVIGYTLQMLTRFSMKKSLKIPTQVIRSRNSKDRQHHGQKKKRQTTIYKALHRKLKIEQHEQHLKRG